MPEFLTFAVLSFTAFFTLINPLGVMPVFMTMTSSLEENQRRQVARKATIIAFFTLVFFAVSGQLMFDFLGISVNSFRIVGGIIFFFVGLDMLKARIVPSKIGKSEIKQYAEDISITPLAIPIICGPGAITNVIVLTEDADTAVLKITLLAVLVIISLVTYFVLFSSTKIIRILGETGNKVMMRMMGLIVMVIAVEFFFAGLTPIVRSMINP